MYINTYKVVDMVCIVNDGADLTLQTNGNWSKNVGTSSDKPINLHTASNAAMYFITVFTVHLAEYSFSVLILLVIYHKGHTKFHSASLQKPLLVQSTDLAK